MEPSKISARFPRSSPILLISQLGLLGLSAGWFSSAAFADEHLFGWVLGAETLPSKHAEAYEFLTLRTGKAEGTYLGWDSETEVEYGFTDQFQASLSLENHYFYNKGVDRPRDALNNTKAFRFGGVVLSGKYRLLSPFKDPVGLALRLEAGYLPHDEVDGLKQNEGYVAPQLILQKNYFDDTLIFAGPSLHYGSERWWVTLSYGYQIHGTGIDEPADGKTFAEEVRNEIRLKVGLNF
jgi:hypothetical protein